MDTVIQDKKQARELLLELINNMYCISKYINLTEARQLEDMVKLYIPADAMVGE